MFAWLQQDALSIFRLSNGFRCNFVTVTISQKRTFVWPCHIVTGDCMKLGHAAWRLGSIAMQDSSWHVFFPNTFLPQPKTA
jgi:hypothetical protein